MKVVHCLRRSLLCCSSTATIAATSIPSSTTTIKNRLSGASLFNHQEPPPPSQEPQEEDSLIDGAAAAEEAPGRSSSFRSTVVGTIFGRRRGHVSFCVQSDPSAPPPFLFELSIPTHLLAKEMNSGLLRVALECRRHRQWKAYCNGRNVGYAVRRKLTESDRAILGLVRSMSAGAGLLQLPKGDEEEEEELGEMLYMRARYERVVGSRDSVSYHMINPAGGGGGGEQESASQQQQLSVFLLRTD